VKLLVDSHFPATTAVEAPTGLELIRWTGGTAKDEDLVRKAADLRVRGLVLLDRRALQQPGLRELAEQLGVALVAVEAGDPIEAKERLLRNVDHLRKALALSNVVLLLAHEARPA
jgi:hypothetical protein